ncbi:MAG: M3 family metallopeptidase, partial [Paracoccaceae bacterium]
MTNPLLDEFSGPHGLPPYEKIEEAHFAPAFDAALAEARARIAAIADNPAAADFENTITALELAEALLDRVSRVFFNLTGGSSTEGLRALERDLAPRLAAYGSEVMMNQALFARVEELWTRRDALGLSAEQERVLMLYRRNFVRAGAALDGAARQRMGAIKERLAVLTTQFSQNLLADERGWTMALSESDLEGLPDFVRRAAAAAAAERDLTGHILTLSRSLVVPFLQFSPRRDLREKVYRAWVARGQTGGVTDNRAIAAEILALRQERAQLLGYPNFASYKLEAEMAGTPQAVRDLLQRGWEPARARAEADQAILA